MNWISTKDRLPDNHQWVLVSWNREVSIAEFKLSSVNKTPSWSVVQCIGTYNDVSYDTKPEFWAELPEAPE